MNEMPRRFVDAVVGSTERLTALSAKSLLEWGGAQNVNIKARNTGKLFAFFEHFGKGHVWSIRMGAIERNFARDLERELTARH